MQPVYIILFRLEIIAPEPDHTHEHVALALSAPSLIAGASPKLTHFVQIPFGRCTKCAQTWTLAPAAILALRSPLLSFAAHDPPPAQTTWNSFLSVTYEAVFFQHNRITLPMFAIYALPPDVSYAPFSFSFAISAFSFTDGCTKTITHLTPPRYTAGRGLPVQGR